MQKLNCCCKMTAESACFTALGLGEVVNCSKRTAVHLFVAAPGESRRAEGLQCRLGAGGAAWDPGCSAPQQAPCHPMYLLQVPCFSGWLLKGLERGV